MAIAGAVGTLSRYGLATLLYKLTGGAFPYGTLAVNALGCFLFGLVWAMSGGKEEVRLIVLVGFMGAFTTFSTFAAETGEMMKNAEWAKAGANIVAQNVLGVALFFAGTGLVSLFQSKS
jgi:CrcB protein